MMGVPITGDQSHQSTSILITHPSLSPLSGPVRSPISPSENCPEKPVPVRPGRVFQGGEGTFALATWQGLSFLESRELRDIHFFHSLGIEENNKWMMINFTMDIVVGYQTVK